MSVRGAELNVETMDLIVTGKYVAVRPQQEAAIGAKAMFGADVERPDQE